MSERSLRGTQLGSRSLETEEGVEPAPRQMVEFECEDGTRFKVPFSIEAEVPSTWDSGIHGIGIRVGMNEPDGEPVKHVRSHWDMLLERRSFDELQVLFDERLAIRRGEVPAQSGSPSGRTAAEVVQIFGSAPPLSCSGVCGRVVSSGNGGLRLPATGAADDAADCDGESDPSRRPS